MEKENRMKFWLPNDTQSPEKASHDECCIAPVKAFPVATKERMSDLVLPSDVLVQIVLNLRHDELEPLSSVSSTVREAVAKARKMHFDHNTPVGRSSRAGNACKRPGAPKPKHVWNPNKSILTADDVAELKAPLISLRKMRQRH